MLGRSRRFPPDEFGLAADGYENLARSVEQWRHVLTAGAPPVEQPAPEVERSDRLRIPAARARHVTVDQCAHAVSPAGDRCVGCARSPRRAARRSGAGDLCLRSEPAFPRIRSVHEIGSSVHAVRPATCTREHTPIAGSDAILSLRLRVLARQAHPLQRRRTLDSTGSVLALDHEVRAADRAGQLRLLSRELNRGELAGTSIPSESLNPTARFFGSSSGYSTLIESPLS